MTATVASSKAWPFWNGSIVPTVDILHLNLSSETEQYFFGETHHQVYTLQGRGEHYYGPFAPVQTIVQIVHV